MHEYEARKEVFVIVADIADLVKTVEFMEDEEVEKAMDKVLSLVANPVMNQEKAAVLIVYFQALSVHFTTRGSAYVYAIGASKSGPEAKRKGFYLTLAKKCDDMSNALKYMVKS